MNRLNAFLLAILIANSVNIGMTCDAGPQSDSQITTTLPCSFGVTQNFYNYLVDPVENSKSIVNFYDYYSASAHTPFVEANASVLYLYLDTSLLQLYLVFHFNIDVFGSPDARTIVGIQGIPAGAVVAVSDDPGRIPEFSLSRYPQGQFQYWYNTDGGALGPLPTTSDWSMKVNITHGGPYPMQTQKWVSTNGTRLPLAMTGTIVVESKCNQPPVPDAGGAYIGMEGSPILFKGGNSTDPDGDNLTYRWDFDSDGTFDTSWSSSPVSSHTYGDDWVGMATLEVSDGKVSATASANVTVMNVSPLIDFILTPSGDEGIVLVFEAHITDPGSDDIEVTWSGSCIGWSPPTMYPNDPTIFPDPYPSPEVNPRNMTDTQTVVCGDNGVYWWDLKVEDDDGGITTLNGSFSVSNLLPLHPPAFCPYIVGCNSTRYEGANTDYWVAAVDNGSDDLTFDWTWGDGSLPESRTYYNNGVSPDPPNSPDGTYPFFADEIRWHAFGDDGKYLISVTTQDDDGGSTYIEANVTILNLPPSLSVPPPQVVSVDEGNLVTLAATASDPGSDDLTFTWNWDYGPTYTTTFYNNGVSPDPPNSPLGTFPFTATDSSSHTYGDDCPCEVSLTVEDDDGGSLTYTTTVNVLNLPPSVVGDVEAYAKGSLILRVAGEKYHDVKATVYLNGVEKYTATVFRIPGSPDAQAVTLGNVTIDLLRNDTWNTTLVYTPLDDPINGRVWGATPAWLIFRSEHGNESRIHHTFNARHEDTWIWDVPDLRAMLIGIPINFKATATDPGSDDLIFSWDSGDGRTVTSITYNNGVSPDPYPSPDVNPITAMSEVTLAYGSAGVYTITLTVMDDDGGSTIYSFTINIGM